MSMRKRRLALGLSAAALGMLVVTTAAPAVTPTPGTTPTGTTTPINESNGPQRDPHVSGSLVAYTDFAPVNSRIHVFDLGTGVDTAIPGASTDLDFLSDVNGTNVVFTRVFPTESAIMRYSTASGTVSELDPQSATDRTGAAIGGGSVAWMDLAAAGASGMSEIVAHDLAGGVSTRLTNDAFWDQDPAVAPGGDLIVWTKCTGSGGTSGCDLYKALRSGSVWGVSAIPLPGEESLPDTDGSIVVYDSTRAGEVNIYWQPVTGGPEQQLELSGPQRNANVSNGLVTFELQDPAASVINWDVALYEVATNTLYRLTNTLTDEYLNDVDYDPSTRTVRVAYTRSNNATGDDVYAFTFTLPGGPQYAALIGDVHGQVQTIADDNPGTPLGDKAEDVAGKLAAALAELGKEPADGAAALGNLEGAAGDLESMVKDGLLTETDGEALMDTIAQAGLLLADEAIADAIARGGDAAKIVEAENARSDGNARRAADRFKDALGKYKESYAKATGA